jgi:DNA-binding response OmpR family regulator
MDRVEDTPETMSAQARYRILLIDDEEDFGLNLKELLPPEYELRIALDGETGIRMARAELPDLVLLDINMPQMNGIEVCQVLRTNEATRVIPVIMLTANDQLQAHISAFSAGADDYITKPYSTVELVARIRSKLRRIAEIKNEAELIRCGNLELHTRARSAFVAGRALHTTRREFEMLQFFAEHVGEVLSRERLLQALWRDVVVTGRAVDNKVLSLRKKLRACDHEIRSLYASGYSFVRREPQGQPDGKAGS